MDVKITLVTRPPVSSAVVGGEHFRNVPVETDGSLSVAADNCPVRSRVVSWECRESKEGGEGQRLVVRGDVEAVLLLPQIAVLRRMARTAGGGDTSRHQSQADGREGHAVGPTQRVSPWWPLGRECVWPIR